MTARLRRLGGTSRFSQDLRVRRFMGSYLPVKTKIRAAEVILPPRSRSRPRRSSLRRSSHIRQTDLQSASGRFWHQLVDFPRCSIPSPPGASIPTCPNAYTRLAGMAATCQIAVVALWRAEMGLDNCAVRVCPDVPNGPCLPLWRGRFQRIANILRGERCNVSLACILRDPSSPEGPALQAKTLIDRSEPSLTTRG